MSEILESLIRENLLSVFGERDAKKRRGAIARIWAANGVFVDHGGRHAGHADLNSAVEQLLQKYPDWVLTERGPIDAFHKIGRLPWNFGPPGAPPAVTGLDVVVTENDKIVALYTFVDAPERPGGHPGPGCEKIARRAYQLWEERGRPHGSPEEDWHRAEDELRSNS